ncbi:MAG TPA: lysylphosphatidylglycerol synthase transmembrane domain-containing protein [Candidatus Saccharimonadales bacterium]|nr:lysylphosphatidylglycerol synthase transmembrane domain-containing protein [Candidatus Saccharimonadales bacterium]
MNWKLWLNLITFIALLVLIWFARHDILLVFDQLRNLNLLIVALMIPAQLLVYISLAKLFYCFFYATGTHLKLKDLFAPMVELNFVNHIFPSGGVSGFSYLTLRLRPYGVSTAKSTLAQLARFAFMFIGFIVLLLVALLLLAFEGRVSTIMVLAVSAVTFTLLFVTTVLIFVIGSESRISGFTGTLARMLNRFIHIFRRRHPETISLANVKRTFLELHEDYILIRKDFGRMKQAMLWAMIANLAELLLLYLAFAAHGTLVNPGAVIVAYVVANLAGYIAILPGGVGIYEPLMTAVLISGGVQPALALSATLVYRVISLLLSLISGYFLYHKAIHRYGTANVQSK